MLAHSPSCAAADRSSSSAPARAPKPTGACVSSAARPASGVGGMRAGSPSTRHGRNAGPRVTDPKALRWTVRFRLVGHVVLLANSCMIHATERRPSTVCDTTERGHTPWCVPLCTRASWLHRIVVVPHAMHARQTTRTLTTPPRTDAEDEPPRVALPPANGVMLAVARAFQAHGREWLTDQARARNAMDVVCGSLPAFGRGHGRCNFGSLESIQAMAATGTVPLRVLKLPNGKFQQARPSIADVTSNPVTPLPEAVELKRHERVCTPLRVMSDWMQQRRWCTA